MIAPRMPRPVFGIPILDKAFDGIAQGIERALSMKAVAPLRVEPGTTGPVISVDLPLTQWVTLTANGGSGSYSATQVIPGATGTWTVPPSPWMGTVKEFNANASLPVTGAFNVEVEYFGEVNEWRFQAGTC